MKEDESLFGMTESFKEDFDLQLKQLRRFTNHGPTLGRYIELLLINLLQKYSPKSVEFSSGFVYANNPSIEEKASPQIDIICFDRLNYPIIVDSKEFKVVAPKSTKAFIEVKSTLTKKDVLKGLEFLEKSLLNEVPITTKLYFISTTSKIKPKATIKLLKEYYQNNPKLKRVLGGIYSLDWNEMIQCDFRPIKSDEIKFSCLRLNNPYGIAPLFSSILRDSCDIDALLSIVNMLGPSIYLPIESFDIILYSTKDVTKDFKNQKIEKT